MKDVLKGSAALFAASIIARGASMLFRYLAAVNLSASDYGQLSLYISLFLSMSTIASFGIAPSLAKLAVPTDNDAINKRAYYDNSIILVAITSMVSAVLFAAFLRLSSGNIYTSSIVFATVLGMFLWSYYQISIGFCLADLKFNLASIFEASDGTIKLALIILASLFLAKNNLTMYILIFALSYVVLAFLSFVVNHSSLRLSAPKIPFHIDGDLMKSMLGHTSGLMIITFTSTFFSYILRLYLSKKSNYDVALFDMALLLYSAPRQLFVSLVRPVVPYATRNRGAKIKIPALKNIVLLFIVAFTLLYIVNSYGFGERILKAINLKDYLKSFSIFLIIMTGALFDLLFGFLSGYLQGYGKINAVAAISVAVFVVMTPVSFLIIKSYGATGAAISFVTSMIMTTALTLLYVYKYVGLEIISPKQVAWNEQSKHNN